MRKTILGVASFLTVAVALTACGSNPSAAESGDAAGESSRLAGKTIEFVVPFSPGGGYDQYARMLAPELAKKLGAKVVVINKPGAGGILATNEAWNAEPDGTTIVMFNTIGHVGSALAEAEGIQYEVEGFSYIGRVSSEPDVVLTKSDSEYESIEDIIAADNPIKFAATGPGSNEFIDPVVLQDLLGITIEMVTGFEGGSEAYLALLQGNVDAHSRSLYSQLPGVEAGDARPLLVIGSESVYELDGVPTLLDIVPDAKRELAETHVALIESGRTIAGPPGMDEALLEEFRTAFEEVATDQEFAAKAEETGRPVSFASGAEVESMIQELMGSSADYVELLRKAFGTN